MADNVRPDETATEMQPLVSIIMGSKSDWPVMKEASLILEELAIPYEKEIVSAHRTPDWLFSFAEQAQKRGHYCRGRRRGPAIGWDPKAARKPLGSIAQTGKYNRHPGCNVRNYGAAGKPPWRGILEELPGFPGHVKIHLYGKGGNAAPKRKMGHLLIKADRPQEIDAIIRGFEDRWYFSCRAKEEV